MADDQTVETPTLDIESTVEDIAAAMMPQEEAAEAAAVEEEAAPEAAEAAPAPAAEKEPATVDTVQPAIVDTPPDTWRKEAKEAWAGVPPVVREEMRKREADISGYVASIKQPVALGEKLTEVITPYLPMFEQTQTDVWENMRAMFKMQERLVNGSPEEKLAIVQGFAQQAGVKFENGQLATPPDGTAQYVRQLEQRLAGLEGGVKSVATIVQEARLNELQQSIRRFAEDTEAHPYFNEVADGITHLITKGAARDLEHAYQTACAADPVVRQKMIDAAMEKSAAAKTLADKERAEKARITSRSRVRSTVTAGTQQPPATIDDTLKTTLAEINART